MLLSLNELLEKSTSIDGTISGVYFLFLNFKLIYIGSSENLHSRISQHKKDKKIKFDSYSIIEITKDWVELEAEYIFKFFPKHNKTIQSKNNIFKIETLEQEAPNQAIKIDAIVLNNKVYVKKPTQYK